MHWGEAGPLLLVACSKCKWGKQLLLLLDGWQATHWVALALACWVLLSLDFDGLLSRS